jgi:endoglucanase
MRLLKLLIAVAGSVLALCGGCSLALAGVASSGLAGASSANPLGGMRWGNYSGPLDEVFPAYRSATGDNKRLLGLIALRPRVRWFGSWVPDPGPMVRQYIDNVTGGDPGVLAQMAVFRLVPWQAEACRRLPSAGEQSAYKRWIDSFAAGIGASRVALILQPDLPFALCVPRRSKLPLSLVAYAAQKFASLAHTTVYIDVGASDWTTVNHAVAMLRDAGVRYARGFALGATHYASTENEIAYGGKLVRALAAAHLGGRHFVINTAQNGRPFTYAQYHGPNFDNAPVCRSRASRRCVTLGIPPTWKVTDSRWHLSAGARRTAARSVDAYLWIGRPWLFNQNDPFDLSRSLALARTTPF